ncbi:MAG: RluA family pseudouridine synthase [Spirochaetes bacterium]|nr:RluA family pseudouridine synthase [Spirochaetota bacterium]
MKEEIYSFIATDLEEGERVDTVLAIKINKSRSFIKNSIDQLLINDKSCKLSKKLKKGDRIFIRLRYNEISDKIVPQKGNINIIYEDNYFLIVKKEPGIPVHPSAGHYQDTYCNYIMQYLIEKGIYLNDAGIIHRLDKDTEGILLFAKDKYTQEKFRELFKKRKIKKYYFAICYNKSKINLIKNKIYLLEDYISRDKTNRLKFTTKNKEGKFAQLKFKPIFFFDEFFIANIKLITGRTHQIRVQFADRGFPIVGDIIYNSPKDKYYKDYGLLLYSYKIEFLHPLTNNYVSIICRIPDRFKFFLIKNNKKNII